MVEESGREASLHVRYGHREMPGDPQVYGGCWRVIKRVACGEGQPSEVESRMLRARMAQAMVPEAIAAGVMAFEAQGESLVELLDAIDAELRGQPKLASWVLYEALSVAVSDSDLPDGEIDRLIEVAETLELEPLLVTRLLALCVEERELRSRRWALLAGEEE